MRSILVPLKGIWGYITGHIGLCRVKGLGCKFSQNLGYHFGAHMMRIIVY